MNTGLMGMYPRSYRGMGGTGGKGYTTTQLTSTGRREFWNAEDKDHGVRVFLQIHWVNHLSSHLLSYGRDSIHFAGVRADVISCRCKLN